MFELAYGKFLKEQQRSSSGMRLEMLKKHGPGERKLLELLWSVFKSFEGIELEYEVVTSTGVRNYIDAFYKPLRIAFEAEGFVVHAEKITRDRFDSEKNKVRSVGIAGYLYFPFSWDEMDKRPELCKRSIYEVLGQRSTGVETEYLHLAPYEREIIRLGLRLTEGFRISDIRECLQCSAGLASKLVKSLHHKRILRPANPEARRHHRYLLEDDAHKHLR
ncbi:hypothetical protein [Cohnella yongneupensis]|uniref:MarR family transcriptional regulator n=1 Tax=Cohnella yongneupensis TaxID=425006 RepID=A0ABW0R638_9BACL